MPGGKNATLVRTWHAGTALGCSAPCDGTLVRTMDEEPADHDRLLLLLLSTALVNNVVLVKFLGLCPFMGVSRNMDSALGMGLATTFVITLACAATWMLEHWLLAPFGLGYLRILTFILVIAATVQFVEMVGQEIGAGLVSGARHLFAADHHQLRGARPGAAHCPGEDELLRSLVYGFGSALGFTLVLLIFAGLRERLALARVPAAFAGAPVSFILASLLSLAFMGFAGLNFQ
jgi:electron transport complex protein RnfA